VPSTTPPGSNQKPQSFLQHPFPHTFPSSFKAMAFLRIKAEHGRCPARTALLAKGNLGSGPRLGFPRLSELSEKLAGVLLPCVRGLGAADASLGKGKSIPPRAVSGSVLQRVAGRLPQGACALSAASCFWGTLEAEFPSLSHLRADLRASQKLSPQLSRKAGARGWQGGLFAGNCESTFLHGCVPLCNGNPLSRVKRRPSYHDLLCRFPWIPCTINKKRNFKPVFNPA